MGVFPLNVLSWHLLHFNLRVYGIYRRLSGAVLFDFYSDDFRMYFFMALRLLLLSLSSALQEPCKPGGLCDAYSPTLYRAMWLGNRRSHTYGIIDGGGAGFSILCVCVL